MVGMYCSGLGKMFSTHIGCGISAVPCIESMCGLFRPDRTFARIGNLSSERRPTAAPSQRLKKTREQPARETGKGRGSPAAGRERHAGRPPNAGRPAGPPANRRCAYRRFFARAFVAEAKRQRRGVVVRVIGLVVIRCGLTWSPMCVCDWDLVHA